MSTPRQRPEPSQPHASQRAGMNPVKGQSQHFTGAVPDSEPHSLRFKLGIAVLVIFVIVVIITIVTDTITTGETMRR